MQTTLSLDRKLDTWLAAGAAALLGLAVLAFWPAYLSKLPNGPEVYAHFHAAIATAWLLLLVVQPLLIRRRRFVQHRWLGRITWVLAPLYVITALQLANHRFGQMSDAVFERAAFALYLPVSMTLLFAASYLLAVMFQRDTRLHARFMICTALTAFDPILARVIGIYLIELPDPFGQLPGFLLMVVVLLLLTVSLPKASRERPVFAKFAAGFTAVLALWFYLPTTAVWFAFASWFRALPLT